MVTVNHNYLKLPGSYLFSTIGKKVRAYKEENPDKEVISLGIGDGTEDAMLQQMRFLFLMVQKVIPVIFRRFSEQIIRLLCVTRFIRFMWIPMLWRAVPESIIRFVKILTV